MQITVTGLASARPASAATPRLQSATGANGPTHGARHRPETGSPSRSEPGTAGALTWAATGSPPRARTGALTRATAARAATGSRTRAATGSPARAGTKALAAAGGRALKRGRTAAPARTTPARSAAGTNTPRLRALHNALPATRYSTSATRLSRAAAAAQARAARVVSPVLWRQHRVYGAVRLQHPQAARRLRHAGLGWRSSGHCANRHRRSCTSLDAVRLGTLWGVVNLKRRSGCPVVVTGGTEVGHANGAHSHGAGYKLDIEHNKCINRFIRKMHRGQVRGDGADIFYERRPQGYTIYANEPSHWDIMFL
ncbi:hypothetical protein [Sphaerisporangium album]|uniref:hypothetical protein n=1 Tax=Sphaerisporangium album TaxID=509200 RepID=UPI0011C04D31|nr:hypothetical protein [Sphaerisporangium album]